MTQSGRAFAEVLNARLLGQAWFANAVNTGNGIELLPEYRDYAYDPVGNRTEAAVKDLATAELLTTFCAANRLNQYDEIAPASGGLQTLIYDEDGNLGFFADGTATTLYSYDAENRLVRIGPQSPVNGNTKSELVYDYLGRRVQKVVFTYAGSSWTLTADTRFVYDGWNLVEERDAAGAVQKTHVWGLDVSNTLQGAGGIGGLLASIEGATVRYVLPDANGNVGQLIDAATNTIAAHYEYDPFGNETYTSGSAENPFRFSTKFHDPETGLVYYGYRYYAPELGRWLTRDPIVEPGFAVVAASASSPRELTTRSSRNSAQDLVLRLIQAATRLHQTGPKHAVRIPDVGADAGNPYLFVLNNPISLLDLLGLRVEVWSHSVGLQSSGGSTDGGGPGFQHSSVRMYPDDLMGLLIGAPNVPLLQDQNGDAYVVLSAGEVSGLLVSALNRLWDRHVRPNSRRGVVRPPAGMTDTDFILSLLAADARYGDNLDYDFCPPIMNGHNSNSYVSGLLRPVGATPPGLSGTRFPGWNQPVPRGNF